MSTFDSDDQKAPGYFLPEDSQFRLKKLREYAEFLSHLAQPRIADEEREGVPEIRPGEVAICLELLAEQMGLVLDDFSWPAYRFEREAAPGAEAEPESAEEVTDHAGGRYLFGVTLDQIDELNLLIDMIRAHGDVVINNNDAEFAEYTLSVLGHAIFCDAEKLRDIFHDVQSQRLREARGPQTGVGEERAVYHAGPARWPLDSASHAAGSVDESLHGGRERGLMHASAGPRLFDGGTEAILHYH